VRPLYSFHPFSKSNTLRSQEPMKLHNRLLHRSFLSVMFIVALFLLAFIDFKRKRLGTYSSTRSYLSFKLRCIICLLFEMWTNTRFLPICASHCRPAKITGAHTTANVPAVIKKAGTKDQCEGSGTVYNSVFFFFLITMWPVSLQVDGPITGGLLTVAGGVSRRQSPRYFIS